MKNMPDSSFVKNYYDEFLSHLGDYTEHRWHSSPAKRFDYKQTKAVIQDIIKDLKVASALEIGPGDGVWTEFLAENIPAYTIIDQSTEMIKRLTAKFGERLKYIQSDFLAHQSDSKYDVVFAIRCFEYFLDKNLAFQKFRDLLSDQSFLIITTKNKDRINSNRKPIHRGQLNVREMKKLATDNGFEVVRIYMTTVSLKSNWFITRAFFNLVFKIGLKLNWSAYNRLWNLATESYTYVLRKK